MMHRGYIKLYRSIQDNDLWGSEPFTKAQAWIDLVLLANHSDKIMYVRGIEILIKRGQVAVSQEVLSRKWRWSRNKILRFLRTLETKQQIEQQKAQQNSRLQNIISIINYEEYQSTIEETEQQTKQQKDNKRNNKRRTNNNDNNYKNVKNEEELNKDIHVISKNDECEKIKNIWNDFASDYGLKPLIDLTPKRKIKILARSKEKLFDLEMIFEKIRKSDFMKGLKTGRGVTFDFIFHSKDNYLKILEGNYDNDRNNEAFKFTREDFEEVFGNSQAN